MTYSQQAIVNQRLYFCRLHIDWLEQKLQQQDLPKHVLQQSLGESIIFHLVLAYQAYLSELYQAYTTLSCAVLSAHELIGQLGQKNMQSAEARECLLLESNEQWLGQLLEQFQTLGPVETKRVSNTAPQSIAFSEVDINDPSFNVQRLKSYLDHLNTLINNHRSHIQEW